MASDVLLLFQLLVEAVLHLSYTKISNGILVSMAMFSTAVSYTQSYSHINANHNIIYTK